jgi:hypothetical protein
VVGELDDLDQPLVRRRARDDEARGLQALAQGDRDLVAVAVALVDDRLAVELAGAGVGWSFTGSAPRRIVPPRSETSFCSGSRSMTGHSVSMSNSVELAPVHPGDVAGELRHGDLHAEADPEVRHALLAGDRAARILPSMPRPPKPPGTRMPSAPARRRRASSEDVRSSESTQSTSRRPPWSAAAWRRASVTDL